MSNDNTEKEIYGVKESVFLDTVKLVARGLKNKFEFGIYDSDDIEQEIFIISLDAMKHYNHDYPLDNFLRVNAKNRLITLKRDKFFRPDAKHKEKKQKLNSADSIQNTEIFEKLYEEDVECNDLLEMIEQQLPANMREDYLKLLAGVKLTKIKRDRLINEVLTIINLLDK